MRAYAWTLIELGQILRAAGREAEAIDAFGVAVAIADRKGDVVTAARAKEQMT